MIPRAQQIACPTCTAGAGQRCRSTIGTVITGFHSQRLIAGDRAYLDRRNERARNRQQRCISVKAARYEQIKAVAKARGVPTAWLVEDIVNKAIDAEAVRP